MESCGLLLNLLLTLICFCTLSLNSPNRQRNGQCLSIHETEGRCVPLEICPPFLEMLLSAKAGHLPSDKLRILQRYTCDFNGPNPLICCPNSEIVSENSSISTFVTQSQSKIKASTHKEPSDEIKRLQPPDPSPTKHMQTEVPTKNTSKIQITSLRSHKNFNRIPSFQDCSNTMKSDRIVGGNEAALASHPWMARIGYLNLETGEIEFYCGGTVINSRYILTAAHCTEEIDDEFRAVVVRLGEHDVTQEEDCSPSVGCIKAIDYVIEKLIPHEHYQKDDKSNDIELIRVNRNISFESLAVRPICLPFINEYNIQDIWQRTFSRNLSRPIKSWVAGWGRTKWNIGDESDTLQEVQLPLVSNEYCQHNYSGKVPISEKQICAGGIKGKDSCGGDSGGPLMQPIPWNGDPKFFQIGVVSFGPVQCGISAGLPGVYTRVSSYLKWILDNIEI